MPSSHLWNSSWLKMLQKLKIMACETKLHLPLSYFGWFLLWMFKNLNIYQHSTNTDVLCTQGKFFDEEAILGELSEKLKEVRKIRHHAKDVFVSVFILYFSLCQKWFWRLISAFSQRMQDAGRVWWTQGFSGFRVTRDGVNEILKGFDNYEGFSCCSEFDQITQQRLSFAIFLN